MPPRPPFQTFRRRAARRAFSLIEVVMSLGIVTFAIVPLVAMLPVGLRSVRDAADQAVQATILQAVSAKTQQTPYAKLSEWTNTPLYFDAEGLPSASRAAALYEVTISVSGTLAITSATNTNASTVTVKIASTTQAARSASFPIHVARIDKN